MSPHVSQNRKSVQSHPSLNYKTPRGKKPRKTTAREDMKKTTKLKHENQVIK